MRIPIEILQGKKALTPLDENSKSIQDLLSLDQASFIKNISEQNYLFKEVIQSQVLFDFYNMIDQLLEDLISKSQEEGATHTYEEDLFALLHTLQLIVSVKMNRSLFRSLDRLLEILKFGDCLTLIQLGLNIFIVFFKNREIIQKKEYEYFEPQLPELLNLVKIYMCHQNMNNKSTVNLCDYFRDDPGYSRYFENNKQDIVVTNFPYDNRLNFECVYPSNQTQNYDEKKTVIEVKEPILLSIQEDNIYHFQNMSMVNIADIILQHLQEKHQIILYRNSPYYQALKYRIFIAQVLPNINIRMQVVKNSLMSLQAYVILRKMFFMNKSRLFEQIFPQNADILAALKDILLLLYFELEPKFHIGILKITSMILQVDENFDFSIFMSEITNQFQFTQKVYKDCTYLTIQNNEPISINPLVLSQKIATQHEFLQELLTFLKKVCKNMIKDDQMHNFVNSIYQISTIINAILKIIEINSNQTYQIFTPQNTILVLEIISLLLPKSFSILQDFQIHVKVLQLLQVHTDFIINKTEIFTYRDEWQLILHQEQTLIISSALHVLGQPFMKKNTSLQGLGAPTYARNIASNPIIKQICQILNNHDILNSYIVLIADIIQEVPQLVDQFINDEILQLTIQALQDIPKDSETLPNVVYFVNMYCLTEKGREIEKQYKVIDKIIQLVTKKDYIDVLAMNKGQMKHKCFDSLALELCEMINFVDYMKEPVLESLEASIQHMTAIVKDFDKRLIYAQKGIQEEEPKEDFFALSQHETIVKMTLNYTKFFSKLFNQRSVIVKNLCESKIITNYLSIIGSYTLQLQENKTFYMSNKQIAYESKYVDGDITQIIINHLKNSISELEEIVNIKEQSSLNINLNSLMNVKKGGLKYMIDNPKAENNTPSDILRILGNIETLLDFTCMVKIGKEPIIEILDKLSNLYIILVKQQNLEEMYVQNKQIDLDLKKCNLLTNIRKFFISSIKSIPQIDRKNDQVIIRSYALLVGKLLSKLETNCSKLNVKYIDHAWDFLMSYNEVFKRYGKMNPWILITLNQQKSLDNLFEYCIFNLKEFDEQKQNILNNLSLLLKQILFMPQDTTFSIEINGTIQSGAALQSFINQLFLNQLTNLESLLNEVLFSNEFSYQPLKAFFDMIFEKLNKISTIINQEDEKIPKKEPSTKQNTVLKQLMEMGFSEHQADTALREIEYPDVNLAAEWLFAHPDLPMPTQPQQQSQTDVSLMALTKDSFQSSAMLVLNNIGRMFIYQLFFLPSQSCAEFVLSLINYQPNLDTKKLLFNELSYILLSSIQQITNGKKFKFKVHVKGRNEVVSLFKQEKLIRMDKQTESQTNKVQSLNTVMELFLRISNQTEPEAKNLVVNYKFIADIIKLYEFMSLETNEEVSKNFFLLTLKMCNEVVMCNLMNDEGQKIILEFLLNCLPRLNQIQLFNKQSLEGFMQLIIQMIQHNQENLDIFMSKKGLQQILTSQCCEIFPGFLELFYQLVHCIIEDDELLCMNIENEIRQFLSKQTTIEMESFLKYFKKYAKSKTFLEVTERLCIIEQDNKQQKKIKLKDQKIPTQQKYIAKPYVVQIFQLLVDTCQNSLLCSLKEKPKNIFDYNLILKTLHVIVRHYPILISLLLKQNCSKFFKKQRMQINSPQNQSFLYFLMKGAIFVSGDKLRQLLYELCLDNSFCSQQQTRQKVVMEIYETLQTCKKVYTSQQIHTLLTYTSLHTFLLSLKEIVKLSLKEEYPFISLYQQIFIQFSMKNYYAQENTIKFALEPLSILYQYGVNNSFRTHPESNWILDQVMHNHLLIKNQNMIEQWNTILKQDNQTMPVQFHECSQEDDDEDDSENSYEDNQFEQGEFEELVIDEEDMENESNEDGNMYAELSPAENISENSSNSQNSESNPEDNEDEDEDEMDSQDNHDLEDESDMIDGDDQSMNEDDDENECSVDDDDDSENRMEEEDPSEISEESRMPSIKVEKKRLEQDLAQIVNLNFQSQIDQEHQCINNGLSNYFFEIFKEDPLQDEFFQPIIRVYKEIETNSPLILAKATENQWTSFDQKQAEKPKQQVQIWAGNYFNDILSEEEPIEINGNQYIFSHMDRQEDLPFQISQALQSVFRNQSFRTIFANDHLHHSDQRSINIQSLQRQRDADELQNFRAQLLNQISTSEFQQPQGDQQQAHFGEPQTIQSNREIIYQILQDNSERAQQLQQIPNSNPNQQPFEEIQEVPHQMEIQQPQEQIQQNIEQLQIQDQQMQIEQKPFDFIELGLPENFLELHNIDQELFYSLSDDLKMEILVDYIPKDQTYEIQQQAQGGNEQLDFLNSLPPNLREEVLLTYPDDILQQLPENIQLEAQQIRQMGLRNMGFYEEEHYQRFMAQGPGVGGAQKKKKKEKTISEKKKSIVPESKMFVAEDEFIERLVEWLALDNNSFGSFPFELVKAMVTVKSNEFKLIDAFTFQLRQDVPEEDLIVNKLYQRDIMQDDRKEVFQQVSLKVFYLLNKCCQQCASSYFLSSIESKQSIQKLQNCRIKPKQLTPFMFFIDLLQEKEISQNSLHLENLIGMLNNIIQRSHSSPTAYKFAMDEDRVKILCRILTKSDDQVMKKLSSLISIFCDDRENLDLFIAELKRIIIDLSLHLNQTIGKNLSQIQQLNSQMEIEGQNNNNDNVIIAKIEQQFESDFSIQKIFKLIKQLLESCSQEQKEKTDIKQSFQSLIIGDQLNSLWINVSEFLVSLYDNFSKQINLVNPLMHRLTPILECFFIIYKIVNDEQKKEKQSKGQIEIQVIQEEENTHHIEKTFQQMRKEKLTLDEFFTHISEKNKKFINLMVKQNVNILNDSLSLVIKKAPHLLDFENKKLYFKSKIKQNKNRFPNHQIRLKVRRNEIFKDSYSQLSPRQANELFGKLHIEFSGEEGMDAGGLTREWFLLLSKEIFNPNYALFMPSANGNTFQPSPFSKVLQICGPIHCQGIFFQQALHDGYMLDAYFTRAFYKHILCQPLSINDMEDIDPQYYKNLKWILENDISLFDLTFSYEADDFGYLLTKDLIPNGQNIPVTEHNKRDYVKQICQVKMGKDIEAQLKAFLEGFHELIPNNIISIFNNKELELMVSGLPDIDCNITNLVQDLRNNTEYNGYSQNQQIIRDFWDILESFDKQEKAAFIQFVTGTSKVPLEGFKALKGMGNQYQKFTIHKAFDTKKLPTSHTCFNQLDLPDYQSKEILKEKLMLSINEGKEGFGFV